MSVCCCVFQVEDAMLMFDKTTNRHRGKTIRSLSNNAKYIYGQNPFTLVQCECRMLEYEHLFHHPPGADSTCAHVRPEQHTLISVFKLNSCKLCQFKHLRARGCVFARAVRRFVRALVRSAQTRTSERAQILSSLWSIVFEWTNLHKNCQNARLGKYPLADLAG